MMGKEKPIWRLAFFSRLEERKGIKLFVDAVSALNVTDEKFEVRGVWWCVANLGNPCACCSWTPCPRSTSLTKSLRGVPSSSSSQPWQPLCMLPQAVQGFRAAKASAAVQPQLGADTADPEVSWRRWLDPLSGALLCRTGVLCGV